MERNESNIRRERQNITINQKGRPFQNPASPVLILQAKPITNIATSVIPKKIVKFSLNFIVNTLLSFNFTCQPTSISK